MKLIYSIYDIFPLINKSKLNYNDIPFCTSNKILIINNRKNPLKISDLLNLIKSILLFLTPFLFLRIYSSQFQDLAMQGVGN